MKSLESEPSSQKVIAPHEVRELLNRLTEQSLEGVPPTEARTLAGLSLETGIPLQKLQKALAEMQGKSRERRKYWFVSGAALLVVAAFLWPKPQPAEALPPAEFTPPVVQKPDGLDLSGTVTLDQVTYGPDSAPLKVDPNFLPPVPLPAGISVTASMGEILWGTGNQRSLARQAPLKPDELDIVRRDMVALLEYVRKDVYRRGAKPLDGPMYVGPGGVPSVAVSTGMYMYNGAGGGQVNLPPPGAKYDADAKAAIDKAVDTMLGQIQQNLEFQRKNRRMQGP